MKRVEEAMVNTAASALCGIANMLSPATAANSIDKTTAAPRGALDCQGRPLPIELLKKLFVVEYFILLFVQHKLARILAFLYLIRCILDEPLVLAGILEQFEHR